MGKPPLSDLTDAARPDRRSFVVEGLDAVYLSCRSSFPDGSAGTTLSVSLALGGRPPPMSVGTGGRRQRPSQRSGQFATACISAAIFIVAKLEKVSDIA